MIRNFFAYCFNNWLRPVLFFTTAVVFFFVSFLFFDNQYLNGTAITLFLFSLFCLFISLVYQLIKKRWSKAVLTGILLGGTLAVSFFFLAFIFMFIETVDGDHWADNLKIPTNITLSKPLNLTSNQKRPDSILNLEKKNTDFILYNSFQPGLYEYDFWTNKLESGTIYLKAFEITQNHQLSADRLDESTSILVDNPTIYTLKYSTKSSFTIYEGDWGKPYAARFEVWFKPDNNKLERKLFQKDYKIEGWMR